MTAYRRGDRADVLKRLDAWGKLQQGNPARLWLLAETHASLYERGCEADLALKHLAQFETATDPARPAEPTDWRFEEVRWVLRQFDVSCGESFESMRRQATLFGSQLRTRKSLPLVRMADYDALKVKAKVMENQLRRKHADLATTAASLEESKRRLERAPGRDRGLAQVTVRQWQDRYDTGKKAADDLSDSLEIHRQRLASYEQFRTP